MNKSGAWFGKVGSKDTSGKFRIDAVLCGCQGRARGNRCFPRRCAIAASLEARTHITPHRAYRHNRSAPPAATPWPSRKGYHTMRPVLEKRRVCQLGSGRCHRTLHFVFFTRSTYTLCQCVWKFYQGKKLPGNSSQRKGPWRLRSVIRLPKRTPRSREAA